jgi:hypothetical protein
MTSVGEDFPKQQARVRALLPIYDAIGPAGQFGKVMLEATLKQAEEAAISGDIVAILQAYEALKGCE